MIREIGENIWTVDGPNVVFMGVSLNTRMTVVRLEDRRLWVHSPIPFNEDVEDFIVALGDRVAAMVAPNKFHYMFIDSWRERYSEAVVFAHEDLRKRIGSLADAELITSTAPTIYSNDVDQVLFSGNPFFREAVFYHRASASAIFTDLIQNLDITGVGFFARLYAKFDGVAAPDGGIPRLYKWLSTSKKADYKAVETIRRWRPDRVLFCHGDPIELDAEMLIEREFSYLN